MILLYITSVVANKGSGGEAGGGQNQVRRISFCTNLLLGVRFAIMTRIVILLSIAQSELVKAKITVNEKSYKKSIIELVIDS